MTDSRTLADQPDPEEYARAVGWAMIEYWLLLNVVRAFVWMTYDSNDHKPGQAATHGMTDAELSRNFTDALKNKAAGRDTERLESLTQELNRLRNRRNELIHSMYALPAIAGWTVPTERIDPKGLGADSEETFEVVSIQSFLEFRSACREAHRESVQAYRALYGDPPGLVVERGAAG